MVDNRVENAVNSMSLSLFKEYHLFGSPTKFSLGVNSSNFIDEYNPLNGNEQTFLNIGITNRLIDFPLSSSIFYSTSFNQSDMGRTDIKYRTVSFDFRASFFNRKINPYLIPRITWKSGIQNVSSMSPADDYRQSGYDLSNAVIAAEIDTLRLTTVKEILLDVTQRELTGGVEYKFLPRHLVHFRISWINYDFKNRNRYWNDAEFDANQATVLNREGDTSVNFNQTSPYARSDDMVITFSYNYRF